jgi:glycerol uptake facilitator-like aquaporin
MSKKVMAEFFGTYWLVFGGCGSLKSVPREGWQHG